MLILLGVSPEKKVAASHTFTASVDHVIAHIEDSVLENIPEESKRWYAVKLFEKDEKVVDKLSLILGCNKLLDMIKYL